jgi:CRP/FNR family transcriptional regulator, cyclic AMP receptor protein
MAADPRFLSGIPLFHPMDDDERAALVAVMDEETYAGGQVVYEVDDPGGTLHVITDGQVEISLRDDDGEKVVLEVLGPGDFFGELSLIDGGTRSATVTALQPTTAIVLDRSSLLEQVARRPHMAQDLMVAMVKRIRHTDGLLRRRVSRNPNEVIAEQETLGHRVADAVARFGGSWTFIFLFGAVLVGWVLLNAVLLRQRAFDVYPFILLNLFLSMLAAIQAPVIMMSQNRQDAKDRVRSELDYQVNLKAELEVSELLLKVRALEGAMTEVRGQLTAAGGQERAAAG